MYILPPYKGYNSIDDEEGRSKGAGREKGGSREEEGGRKVGESEEGGQR